MGDSDSDKWLDVIRSMPQFRSAKDKRAPYKPLLLLWIIGRLSNGGDPEVGSGTQNPNLENCSES